MVKHNTKKKTVWERQDSNLRRKNSTDLQSVAFNRSATLPTFFLHHENGFINKKLDAKYRDLFSAATP